MINFNESCPDFCYRKLFQNCISLIKAPLLPSLSLGQYSYAAMFSHTSIDKAPKLPATTFRKGYVYSYMFEYTPITDASELPCLTLKPNCYQFMFYSCDKLLNGPKILPSETLESNCYNSMFKGSQKLKKAPELMCTSVVLNACNAMFENCYELSYLKVHFSEWGNWQTTDGIYTGGLNYWTSHAGDKIKETSAKIFVCPQALSEIKDNSHMPLYWTIERF